MLDKVREQSQSIVTYLIVGGIIFVFVAYFGPGSQSCAGAGKSANFAATVNGVPISMATFDNAYGSEFRSMQARGQGMFNAEMAERMNLRETVLDRLVSRELLAQEAERRGIAVSDDELRDEIHKRHDFQKNGEFDAETYRMVLQYLQTTPSIFEAEYRKDLVAQKVRSSIEATSWVSDDEVKADFVRDNERINLEFVRFASAMFKADAAAPTPAESAAWADAHMDKVREFYAKNEFRYNKAPHLTGRQILVKVEEDAPAAKVDAAKKRIDEAKAELDAGKAFADVAKKFSDDAATKDKGGELGDVQRGIRGKTFDDAAFGQEPGKVGAPFRGPQGFYLVLVDKKFPEEKKSVDDVKAEVAAELMKDEKAREAARKAAEETLGKLKGGARLAEQWPTQKKPDADKGGFNFDLGSTKPEADETQDFSPSGDFVPRIGVAPEMVTASFAVKDEKTAPWLDKVFEVNNAFYVAAVKSRTRADVSQLDSKLMDLRERAKKRKGEQELEAYLKHLKDQGRIEKNTALLAARGRAVAE